MEQYREYFINHIVKLVDDEGEHWLWNGSHINKNGVYYSGSMIASRDENGYPVSQKANRFAYECWIGPLEDNKVVQSKCKHTLCVNPAHLSTRGRRINLETAFKVGNTIKTDYWRNVPTEDRKRFAERLVAGRQRVRRERNAV